MAGGGWAGAATLIGIGVLLAIIGIGGYGACTAANVGVDVTYPSGCPPFLLLVVFGVAVILLGALVAVRASRYTFVPPAVDPATPPPFIHPVVFQQTVETQIVRVRCQYCGALGDPASRTCASCGAPL